MNFSNRIEKGLDRLDLVLQIVTVVLLSIVIASVTIQVFSRYITQNSLPWTSEVASYAFVWLSMIAVALGVRRGRHMVLNVWEYAPYKKWLARTIETVAGVVVVGVLVALIWYGFEALGPAWRRESPGMGISFGWVSLAVPVGAVFSLIFAIEAWWKLFHAPQGTDPLPSKVMYQPDDVVVIKGEL